MLSRPTLLATVALLVVSLSLWGFPPAASAEAARTVGPTPPRLAFVDGEASFWRSGAEQWTPAQVNTALAAGDALYVADAGNVELEIGARAYVRAGSGTEVQVESLEIGYLQLSVRFGHAAVDLKRLPEGQVIEVDTPNGAFVVERAGYYRFDVDDETTTFTTRDNGQARMIPAGGESVEVPSDQRVILRGTDPATVSGGPAPADDIWDRWNHDRTAQLGERPVSSAYVPSDVAGLDDLDRYGEWRATPAYGQVWVPRDVPVDWAPYSTGRWVWDGYYGWTWVDYSPWGWAPYHYGRWCRLDGYWGWAPGPPVVQPLYAPALVAFFGGPHVGVSVAVGLPFVSWVALGWGEPVFPWWGPAGFVGRPYWGGWGGPHVVNNVVINNTTIVNVHDIHHFDNFRHPHAVIGVDGDHFRRGRADYAHVDHDRKRGLRPMCGDIGVPPVRASLVPSGGRAARPPDRFHARPVIATRAPQDPAQQPHAAGLVPRDGRRLAPPRLVSGGGPRPREQQRERPRVGRNVERPEIDRGPRVEHGIEGGGHATPPARGQLPAAGIPRRAPETQGEREMGGTRGRPPTTFERVQQWGRKRSNVGKPRQPGTLEQPVPRPPTTDVQRGNAAPGTAAPSNLGRGVHRTNRGAVPRLPHRQQDAPPGRPAGDPPAAAFPPRDGSLGAAADRHRGSSRPGIGSGVPSAVAPPSRSEPPGRAGDGRHGSSRPGFVSGAPSAAAPPSNPAPRGQGQPFRSIGGGQGAQQRPSFAAPQKAAPRGEGAPPGFGSGRGGH